MRFDSTILGCVPRIFYWQQLPKWSKSTFYSYLIHRNILYDDIHGIVLPFDSNDPF